MEGTGEGSDFLGWVRLPENYDKEEFARIKKAAEKIKKTCDVFVVIGIGGSYLGSRAVIEILTSPMYNSLKKDTPEIYFAGCSISAQSLSVFQVARARRLHKRYFKIGNNNQPSIAFRVFRNS